MGETKKYLGAIPFVLLASGVAPLCAISITIGLEWLQPGVQWFLAADGSPEGKLFIKLSLIRHFLMALVTFLAATALVSLASVKLSVALLVFASVAATAMIVWHVVQTDLATAIGLIMRRLMTWPALLIAALLAIWAPILQTQRRWMVAACVAASGVVLWSSFSVLTLSQAGPAFSDTLVHEAHYASVATLMAAFALWCWTAREKLTWWVFGSAALTIVVCMNQSASLAGRQGMPTHYLDYPEQFELWMGAYAACLIIANAAMLCLMAAPVYTYITNKKIPTGREDHG